MSVFKFKDDVGVEIKGKYFSQTNFVDKKGVALPTGAVCANVFLNACGQLLLDKQHTLTVKEDKLVWVELVQVQKSEIVVREVEYFSGHYLLHIMDLLEMHGTDLENLEVWYI